MMEIKKLFNDEAKRINYIRRYSSYPVIRQENVAEHSFWVSYYSYLFALDLKERGFKINIKAVLEQALLHDLEESQTGDIVRTFKYYDPDQVKIFKKAEKSIMNDYFNKMFSPMIKEHLFDVWKYSKSGPEGKIVAFADIFCVLIYAKEEIDQGNAYMKRIMKEAKGHLKKFDRTQMFRDYCKEIDACLKVFY